MNHAKWYIGGDSQGSWGSSSWQPYKLDHLHPWIEDQLKITVYNFATCIIKFCVMWGGFSLSHVIKFCNCRIKIVHTRAFYIHCTLSGLKVFLHANFIMWSLITKFWMLKHKNNGQDASFLSWNNASNKIIPSAWQFLCKLHCDRKS